MLGGAYLRGGNVSVERTASAKGNVYARKNAQGDSRPEPAMTAQGGDVSATGAVQGGPATCAG